MNYSVNYPYNIYELWSRHLANVIRNNKDEEKENAAREAVILLRMNFSRFKAFPIEEALHDCEEEEGLVVKEIRGTAPDRVLVFGYPHITFSYSETDNEFSIRLADDIAEKLGIAPEDRVFHQKFKRVGCPNVKRVAISARGTQRVISEYLVIEEYKTTARYDSDLILMKSIDTEYSKRLNAYGLIKKKGDLIGPDFLRISAELVGEDQISLFTKSFFENDFNFRVVTALEDWKKGMDTLFSLYLHQLKIWLKKEIKIKNQYEEDEQKRIKRENRFVTTGSALAIDQCYDPEDAYISYLIARCRGKDHRDGNFEFWSLDNEIFTRKVPSFDVIVKEAQKRLGEEYVNVAQEKGYRKKNGCHVLNMEFRHYMACLYEKQGLLVLSAKDRTREMLHMELPIIQQITTRRNCSLDFNELEDIDDDLENEILEEIRISELVSDWPTHNKCMEVLQYVIQDAAPYIGETNEKGQNTEHYQMYIDQVTDNQIQLELECKDDIHKKREINSSKQVLLDLDGDYQSQWKSFFSLWKMQVLKNRLSGSKKEEDILEKLDALKEESLDPTPFRYKIN